jgi:hypothetical protein
VPISLKVATKVDALSGAQVSREHPLKGVGAQFFWTLSNAA